MADDNTHINPDNATTGTPAEGACCFISFNSDVTLPTSASATLAEDFENVGEIIGEGYTDVTEISQKEYDGWHGPFKVMNEKTVKSFKTGFVEVMRETVAKIRYGEDNVTAAGGTITKIEEGDVPAKERPLVIDELLDDGRLCRTVFPRSVIKNIDDVAHRRGELLVYGMTFIALKDTDGKFSYKYYATPTGTTGQ